MRSSRVTKLALAAVLLGLAALSLIVLISMIVAGYSSIWLLLAAGLLIGACAAYVVQELGQFVVAAVVLILILIGTVAGMLLHPDASISLIPYLFIPIVVITGLILSPVAVVVTAALAISLTSIILTLTGDLTRISLLLLLPPYGLIIIVSLLTIEGGHQIGKLQNLWLDGNAQAQ